jgi:hypothetical protein
VTTRQDREGVQRLRCSSFFPSVSGYLLLVDRWLPAAANPVSCRRVSRRNRTKSKTPGRPVYCCGLRVAGELRMAISAYPELPDRFQSARWCWPRISPSGESGGWGRLPEVDVVHGLCGPRRRPVAARTGLLREARRMTGRSRTAPDDVVWKALFAWGRGGHCD